MNSASGEMLLDNILSATFLLFVCYQITNYDVSGLYH
jgi:hypothetical protein